MEIIPPSGSWFPCWAPREVSWKICNSHVVLLYYNAIDYLVKISICRYGNESSLKNVCGTRRNIIMSHLSETA